MSIKQSHYEELLAEYTNTAAAIALLKQYRPYLEMIPSMRRPTASVITIPLPNIRIRHSNATPGSSVNTVRVETTGLPCDVAMLMCDPEWKVKTGVEIFVFIHRPEEDFSDLLSRWRRTQVLLSQNYEWLMPLRHAHILNEGADKTYPLFVVFDATPERIKRGLKGACLPFVTQTLTMEPEEEPAQPLASESLQTGD